MKRHHKKTLKLGFHRQALKNITAYERVVRFLPDLTERFLDTGDRAQDEGDDHGVEGVALELAKVLAESLA